MAILCLESKHIFCSFWMHLASGQVVFNSIAAFADKKGLAQLHVAIWPQAPLRRKSDTP